MRRREVAGLRGLSVDIAGAALAFLLEIAIVAGLAAAALLIAAIALLVFLILFQQSLQNGLITGFIGAIREQNAPVLVYSVDGEAYVTAFAYDNFGNVISETKYANAYTGNDYSASALTAFYQANADKLHVVLPWNHPDVPWLAVFVGCKWL